MALRPFIALTLAAIMLALPTSAGAIVDGELDTSHDYVVFMGQTVHWTHPSFPSISGPNTVPINQTVCSGSLVSPTVVVTAAHCSLFSRPQVWPNQPWFPVGSPFPQDAVATRVTYVVRQGDNVMTPGGFVQVPGTFHVQPGFTFGGDGLPHFANNDLAVVRLTAFLPGPYAELPSPGYASTLKPTGDLAVVGYGVNELHGNQVPPGGFDFKRRIDEARLLGNNAVADDLLHFNGGACFGDSGGPLLADDVVLGVVAFSPSGCKSTNYATRLDTADSLAFIASFGA